MPEKKGRPTPKRREVEKTRALPRLAPAATKEAKKLQKQQARELRASQRQAYLRGEESALPLRDRGPAKRFLRNYVDSRRTFGEFFLPVAILGMFTAVFPSMLVRFAGAIALYVFIFLVIGNAFIIARGAKREMIVRFPNEPTKGVMMYAAARTTMMRRMRAPLPQVKRGEKV